jgi:hypothetical protein
MNELWRRGMKGTQILLGAALVAIVTASGCADSSSTTSNVVETGSDTTPTPTTRTSTAAANSTRRDLAMQIDTEQMRFAIDGASGDLPVGWEDPHVRSFYVFLGYNTQELPPEVNWLSLAVPPFTGIGPPGTPPAPEPTPPDIYATLLERQVPVNELGTLTVDGTEAPVIQLDGYLNLCSMTTCRTNDPASGFFVLIPAANADLVIEGESNLLAAPGDVTAAEAAPLIQALQTWADSIDLP